MKILLAGGGTGGHINPAIAIANTVKANDPQVWKSGALQLRRQK